MDEKNYEGLMDEITNMYRVFDSLLMGIGNVVQSRDENTGQHVFRTSRCVELFTRELGKDEKFSLSDKFCKDVAKAAPLHDLGKIAIRDAILQKKGRFLPEEYDIMKNHSKEGGKMVYLLLSDYPDEAFVKIAMNIARYHHEKYDGSGYPAGIAGESIPLEARIMALADVFDALVSKRCYKEEYSYDKAFSIIENSIGTHFDPDLGKKFLECRPLLEELYDDLLETYLF